MRALRIVPIVLVLAFVASACMPESPPPPQNGQLPDAMLTQITPECRIVNEKAGDLLAMLADAHDRYGIDVWPETRSYSIVDPPRKESCYRTLEMQQWWRDYYCYFGSCGFAAVPGTSVHGWGRAIDLQDQNGKMEFSSVGFVYMVFNAHRYGFCHPSWADEGQPNAEAWHWEAC
jgi:hypothetical protein